jgi:hypothetical protein
VAGLLLSQSVMKTQPTDIGHEKPRMIAERKPLRPIQIAVARIPIKVTKPISFGEGAVTPVRGS